jgi:Spy/CpxP family protein refolding chaperone
MTDAPSTEASITGIKRFLPQLRSRWWSALLIGSLMLNLLVGGIAIGNVASHGPSDRLMGASYVQLIPRRFLQEMPRERRRELMEIVRNNRADLRALRKASEDSALKLAEALEKDTYTEADALAVITAFSTGSESLAAKGGSVVLDIIRKLTPEERKQLAASIRERGERRKR